MINDHYLTRNLLVVTLLISQILKFTIASQGCKPRGQGTEGFDMSLYHYDYFNTSAGAGFCFSSEYQSYDYMHGGYVTWAGGLFGTSSKITDLSLDFQLPELCTITNGTLPDNFNYPDEFTISNFTMLLTGYFYADMTGDYNFQLEADDLAYLSFGAGNAFDCCGKEQSVSDPDAFPLIVIWKDTDDLSGNVTFSLNEGVYYPLRLLYTNRDFYGVLQLKYTDPSGTLHSDFSDQIFQFPDSPGGCANEVHYTTTVWTGTYTTTYSTKVFTSIGSDGYGTIETIYYIETPTPTSTIVSSSTITSDVESSSIESSSVISSFISSMYFSSIPPSTSSVYSSSVSSSVSTIVSSQLLSSMSSDINSNAVSSSSIPSIDITTNSYSTVISSQISSDMTSDVSTTSVSSHMSSGFVSTSNSEHISSTYSSIISSEVTSEETLTSSHTIPIPSSIPTEIKQLSSESFSGSSTSASYSTLTESRYTNQTTSPDIETSLTSSVPESFKSSLSTDIKKSSNTISTSSKSQATGTEETTITYEKHSTGTPEVETTTLQTEGLTQYTDDITSTEKHTTTTNSSSTSKTDIPITISVTSNTESITGSTSTDTIETTTPKTIVSKDSSETFTLIESASTEIIKWFSTTIQTTESSSLTSTNSMPTSTPSSTSMTILYDGSASKEKMVLSNVVATIIYLACFI